MYWNLSNDSIDKDDDDDDVEDEDAVCIEYLVVYILIWVLRSRHCRLFKDFSLLCLVNTETVEEEVPCLTSDPCSHWHELFYMR